MKDETKRAGANKRRAKAKHASEDGWLTANEVCKELGLKQISKKETGRYERRGERGYFRYKINHDWIEQTTKAIAQSCAGCSSALTQNRTRIFSGTSLCLSCARRVTVGNDVALMLAVFGKREF
jgi:formylmethanofuran dehydrogenase subunit E